MAADLNPEWLSCLPSTWSYGVTRDGRVFFINEEAKSTTWLHPVTGEAVITGHRKTPDLPTGWEEGYTFEGARCFINICSSPIPEADLTQGLELKLEMHLITSGLTAEAFLDFAHNLPGLVYCAADDTWRTRTVRNETVVTFNIHLDLHIDPRRSAIQKTRKNKSVVTNGEPDHVTAEADGDQPEIKSDMGSFIILAQSRSGSREGAMLGRAARIARLARGRSDAGFAVAAVQSIRNTFWSQKRTTAADWAARQEAEDELPPCVALVPCVAN
ncbi:hypothetical protein QQF64_034972 [Cirrhinus molitorella]|uniref:WW domain-containing protein n=1 Tax=Cirrhinus molitorella TaxID=172907 RepID=A0ABR3NEP7_9TELE